MSLVLDAGAFLAVERGDREVMALIEGERRRGSTPVTHGAVVGQVWREGGPRQAALARLLRGTEVVAVDAELGRRIGALLRGAGTSDVVDAGVALLAVDGDEVLTSDPDDLAALVAVLGTDAAVVPV